MFVLSFLEWMCTESYIVKLIMSDLFACMYMYLYCVCVCLCVCRFSVEGLRSRCPEEQSQTRQKTATMRFAEAHSFMYAKSISRLAGCTFTDL